MAPITRSKKPTSAAATKKAVVAKTTSAAKRTAPKVVKSRVTKATTAAAPKKTSARETSVVKAIAAAAKMTAAKLKAVDTTATKAQVFIKPHIVQVNPKGNIKAAAPSFGQQPAVLQVGSDRPHDGRVFVGWSVAPHGLQVSATPANMPLLNGTDGKKVKRATWSQVVPLTGPNGQSCAALVTWSLPTASTTSFNYAHIEHAFEEVLATIRAVKGAGGLGTKEVKRAGKVN